jgi:hypothetical protein
MATPNQIASDPAEFARVFLKIQDKQKNIVPFKWNKAQAHFHANRTGRDIILKARQLGMSTLVQGEMFRRTVTSARTTITLAHDTDTTTLLRLMADRFYDHCKFGNIQPARKYANASLTTYPEFDSSALIATAGNLQSGRGGTYSDFHGSEVAFWKDAEKLVAGAMQGGNPDVVLESTPNGTQGYFYERAMEAMRGEGVWTLHFYPWWWDTEYKADGRGLILTDEEKELSKKHKLTLDQIAWRRNKQKELRDLFIQEYPEDPITCFLTSGNSYFGDISKCYTAPLEAKYNPDHEYVAGLDFGQTNDYTAMIVIDKTARCMVDLLRIRRLEWSEQRRRIAEMNKRWHCRRVRAEANSIGSVNIEELARLGVPVAPFETTNTSKSEIMSDLYEGLHTDGLLLQDRHILRHEMTNFVSTQLPSGIWRLAADGEGHDDTVMALALAWIPSNPIPELQPVQKSKWADGDMAGKSKRY